MLPCFKCDQDDKTRKSTMKLKYSHQLELAISTIYVFENMLVGVLVIQGHVGLKPTLVKLTTCVNKRYVYSTSNKQHLMF